MSDKPNRCRLAAVLIADVAGYTTLVEADTTGTVAAWQHARESVIRPCVETHAGTIVKLTGDGFLVEFPLIQSAVDCAIAIQNAMADHPLDFRIGINLGDIIDDGQDIHGEGVNIAARIESLAEPGGICITGTVHDAVRNRVSALFHYKGEHQVKHVTVPVRVWKWIKEQEKPEIQSESINTTELIDRPKLPAIPSIAVLPFDNLSGDSDQNHFADGMTEDLITDLSKISGLFVVARNSSFAYKGRDRNMSEIAADLGVRYLLEGSVRRAGNRVRINAQLVDGITGNHEWADRYDGSVENVFELQDKVAGKVVSALSIQLTLSESNSLKRVHTNNLKAYELFVSARATPYPPIPQRIEQARQMFKQVIELDAEYAGGYAGESFMLSFKTTWGYGNNSAEIEQAVALANKAIDVDDTFSWSYTSLAMGLLLRKQYDVAINAAKQAIWLQPNDADAHAFQGFIQALAGKYQQAIESIKQAIRYNPQFFNGPYLNLLGIAYLLSGNDARAVDSFQENISRAGPVGPPALCFHAVACTGLEQGEQARILINRIFTEFPEFTLHDWNFLGLIHQDEVRERIIEVSTDLGLPG